MSIYEYFGMGVTIYLVMSGIAVHLVVMYNGYKRLKQRQEHVCDTSIQ